MKKTLYIFLLSLLYCIFITNINFNHVRQNNPDHIIKNSTIYSIDNSWYLPQIKNYLEGKGFTCDASKPKYNVRRTPIYPMFYGIHFVIFGEDSSFNYIRFSQLILFAISCIAIFYAVFNLTKSNKLSFFSFILYLLYPTISIYTQFTITESLYPSLLAFLIYFLTLTFRNQKLLVWFMVGLFFSITVLCRPLLFLILPTIFLILFKDCHAPKLILKNISIFFLALFIVFSPYVYRNYKVTNGEIIFLEKFYGDPMDFGMSNIALRKWIGTSMNPADNSSENISNRMIQNIKQNEIERNMFLVDLVKSQPSYIKENFSDSDIFKQFNYLYTFYEYKYNSINYKNIDSVDKIYEEKISRKTNYFIKQNKFKFYINTPILFLKSIVFQSNTYNIAFLNDYHDYTYKKVIKAIMYLINILSFCAIFILGIIDKRYRWIGFSISLFAFLSFVILIYVFRYFEARYYVPIIPLALISLVLCFDKLISKINFRFTSLDFKLKR